LEELPIVKSVKECFLSHCDRFLFWLPLFLLCFVVQACTNASPQVSALTDIYEINLTASVIAYSTLSSVVISGVCGAGVTEIDDSLDGGNTWQNISANSTTANLTCQKNQNFSATFNFTANPPAPWTGTPTGNYHVLFRSKGLGAYKDPQNLILAQVTQNLGQVVSSTASVHATGSQVSSTFKVMVSGASQHGTSVDAQLRVQ